MKILAGHYSPETAYIVSDYPYGFRMRCQIRYWLEVNDKGTRLWSQTTNPKKGDVWNKAKASTYSLVGVMYLTEACDWKDGNPDEVGHVKWTGLSFYDASKCRPYLDTYREGMTQGQINLVSALADGYERLEARKATQVSVSTSE